MKWILIPGPSLHADRVIKFVFRLVHKAVLVVGNIPKAIVSQPLNNSLGEHNAHATAKSAL
jgi:hypothetical protein